MNNTIQVITRRMVVEQAIKRYRGKKKQALKNLGPNPSPDEVAKIIGEDKTRPKCCNDKGAEAIAVIGYGDYEEQHVCLKCLKIAVVMIEEALREKV